jgi:hypothetical protein
MRHQSGRTGWLGGAVAGVPPGVFAGDESCPNAAHQVVQPFSIEMYVNYIETIQLSQQQRRGELRNDRFATS